MYDNSHMGGEAATVAMDFSREVACGSGEVVTVGPEDTVASAVAAMVAHKIGSLVVADDQGKLVGIITERDILCKMTSWDTDSTDRFVKEVMTSEVTCCPVNTPLAKAQKLMADNGVRHLPITTGGVAVGMLSMRDVVAHRCATTREVRNLVIYALAKLAESRDSETGQHLDRVRHYSRLLTNELAKEEKYSEEIETEFIELIYATCPLHDIGKVSIPDHVLLKPGRLNDREFEIIKTHAAIGAETLGASLKQHPEAGFLRMATDIAAYHHERVDGTGYPEGLAGTDIPLCARIFSCGDVYDALVSKRVYKTALPHDVAAGIIAEGAGTQFDTDVAQAFLQCEHEFMDVKQFYDDATKGDA